MQIQPCTMNHMQTIRAHLRPALCFRCILQVLTNIKEKLSWSQMEVQTKKEQLGELDATLAKKRDILARIKKSHKNLQRDNQRLRERRGLLGDRMLLWYFEDTVDANDLLKTG